MVLLWLTVLSLYTKTPQEGRNDLGMAGPADSSSFGQKGGISEQIPKLLTEMTENGAILSDFSSGCMATCACPWARWFWLGLRMI